MSDKVCWFAGSFFSFIPSLYISNGWGLLLSTGFMIIIGVLSGFGWIGIKDMIAGIKDKKWA